MTGTPIWFGPSERPLFGMLHVPHEKMARAAVVLCAPLGREDLFAHSTYRALAEQLEQHGMAVLRFDYDGTGDSAGAQDDSARVAAWTGSTRAAVELMRAAGAPLVAAVGLRMGATLAALEAARVPLDALVLWDPCRSGRSFLREQGALHSLSIGGADAGDGAVQTPGFRYDAQTAADLAALDITSTDGPLADRILVLTRPDRQHDAKLDARLTGAGHVEFGAALGQRELLNVDGQQIAIPEESVERIATWLSGVVGSPVPLDLARFDLSAQSAVVARDRRGRRIVERPVRIGEAGLFGIVTEAGGGTSSTTVVCLNVAKERRIGPSRMWVDLARAWAGCGLRTLRVDLSGLGDSGTRAGQIRGVVYPLEASADIDDVVRSLAPDDASKVVFVGLCSGAHHALQAGLAHDAQGVCTINPVFLNLPIGPMPTDASAPSRRSRSLPLRAWGHAMAGRRVPKALLGGIPERAWWAINRLGVRRSPVDMLERLVDQGTDVHVVAGAEEALRIRRGANRALRELVRSGRLQFDVIDDLEHSLLGPDDTRRVRAIVYAHVLDHFGTSDTADERASVRSLMLS